jgi:hypothetical protein
MVARIKIVLPLEVCQHFEPCPDIPMDTSPTCAAENPAIDSCLLLYGFLFPAERMVITRFPP